MTGENTSNEQDCDTQLGKGEWKKAGANRPAEAWREVLNE